MEIEFNRGQIDLSNALCDWHQKMYKPIFVYTGPPGSGKTTVIFHFVKRLNISIKNVVGLALTGKAVGRLALTGIPSQTIHSFAYKPTMTLLYDENANPLLHPDGTQKMGWRFVLKDSIPEGIKLIVVDELSMVNDNIMEDLLSLAIAQNIPIIGMGDIDQLPPIYGINSYMLRPDFYLTEIMRQAANNPIIRLSQAALRGIPFECGTYGTSRILREIEFGKNLLTDYDCIICSKNETRDKVNDHIRFNILGRHDRNPVVGDKVICRQNNRDRVVDGKYLTNGTVGWIDYIDRSSVTKNKINVDFIPDYNVNEVFSNLELDRRYITMDYDDRKEYGLSSYEKFEYGHIITAHSSQGSEYNRLLYIDEPFGSRELVRKIRYTAISRAVKSVDIVLSH